MDRFFFSIAFAAYAASAVLFVTYAATRREPMARLANIALIGAAACQLFSLITRTILARGVVQDHFYVPWSNWFESFSFFAFVIAVEFLIIERGRKMPILGAFITPLVLVLLVLSLQSPGGTAIPVLAPALRSVWMALHVPVMFIAYGLFAIGFAMGIVFLIQERQLKSKNPSHLSFRLPPLEELDEMIFAVISEALPILFLGLVLGAVWAQQAWGRFWGWDAKETWALITLLIYATYVYLRAMGGWRGRKSTYFSLIGFCVMVFTYVGVNYFSHLHGFLSGGGK